MSGGKFIKPWQVMDNNYWVIFYAIHIQHFMSDSNSKNNNLGFWKFMNGYEGICMSGGKFLKPWQVTD